MTGGGRLEVSTRELAQLLVALAGTEEQRVAQAERLLDQFIRGEREGYAQLLDALALDLAPELHEYQADQLGERIVEVARGIREHGAAWHTDGFSVVAGPQARGGA